jgi:HD-like signal output (HDOD) protein/ActR/RegA family two-component response regulator
VIRILFVDDEPRVLDGLRRSLRAQRDRWDMTFAIGGVAALDELERASFDVIVSDMRMPDMDGLRLLTAARDRWPHMARVVLSGYMDMEAGLRSTSIAHQFLAKPCTPVELEAVVDRTRWLARLLADERLRSVVGGPSALASRPAVFAELERIVADPSAGLVQVGAIVERDVSLTAALLQVVNSSAFGLPRRVTTVEHAVAYLGANVIRALVLSHEAAALACAPAVAPRFSLATHQAHAVRVAGLARTIVGGSAAADDAFLAGVLHDIGELVLAAQRPEWLEEATALADMRRIPLHEAEVTLFGVSHAEVGAYLVGRWGLPLRIVEAVAHHHMPPGGGQGDGAVDVVAAVYLAGALVSEVAPPTATRSGGTAAGLDAACVDSLGVARRLDDWRAAARAIVSAAALDRGAA